LTGVVALVLAWTDVHTPFRTATALAFLCLGPGAALVAWLHLDDLAIEVLLAIALSLTVDIAVGQAMLWTGAWSPTNGLLVIILLTIVAAGGQAYRQGLKPDPAPPKVGTAAPSPANPVKEPR
jgi:hypothetical protein